jgi:DNA-binding response OmpR family regulator
MGTDLGTIVVVEDDTNISDLVDLYLRREGFRVIQAGTGEAGLAAIEREHPRMAILDVGLPGPMDGLEVCRRVRASRSLPVLMLTARDGEVDRVLGLEMGADDYVTKPFSPRELAARVRTVLRRSTLAPPAPERLEFGDLALDASSREVTRAGQPVPLTTREFDLLWFLASNPRRVFSRSHLMDRVWGHTPALDTGTVTVHIRRLREKLESDPAAPTHLQTVWGVGYRFDP